MAEKQDSGVPWTPLQRRVKAEGNTGEAKAVLGEHLFTLSLSGELTVRELALEKDLPDRPEGWKLNLSMKVHIMTRLLLSRLFVCLSYPLGMRGGESILPKGKSCLNLLLLVTFHSKQNPFNFSYRTLGTSDGV